ncbi:MAG: DUF1919 domain-containing protein [Clostridia bacterium]|nr:DUF1919 domain-containing protein [Clostridia bacterium]
MSFINNLIQKAVDARRDRYLKRLRRRLKNPSPTVISDTCMGGLIYHNLGLKFTSPTINMWISKDEYLDFLENLRGFLSVDMTEVTDSGYSYPVGMITCGKKSVHIHGNHYKSFDELRQKWNERKERVDYGNLFIILLNTGITAEDVTRFEALPYENKLMITGKCDLARPFIVHHKLFLSPYYVPGDMMSYKSKFSKKRFMDDIDYVKFLNKNQKMRTE